MCNSKQFNHRRKYAREIKKLYPINKALQILEDNKEKPPKYYLTNNGNFTKRIQTVEFIKLTK
jgi:ribonucleotide monophosphatase NagD (HAD superfamily)